MSRREAPESSSPALTPPPSYLAPSPSRSQDEHFSPYASHLYNRSASELTAEQEEYVAKMESVRSRWGAWDFVDDYALKNKGKERPVADFSDTEYKDMMAPKFPAGSWQTDAAYVERFLAEAGDLVDRVREGVYAELGRPSKGPDGKVLLSDEERVERDRAFRIAHEEDDDGEGAMGTVNARSWDGLVRKLLHAMMTNDEFYAILGGTLCGGGTRE